MKFNFDNFQIQKWISQTVKARKRNERNAVISPVSFFPSWVMVLKLPEIVHFLQTFADLCKKSKSINAIYLYASERFHHVLSENSIFCRGLSNRSCDIDNWNIKKVLTQQKFNKINQLQTLISSKL